MWGSRLSAVAIANFNGCTGEYTLIAPGPYFQGDEWQWELTEQPFGGSGSLNGSTGPQVVINAPVAGCYTVTLAITSTDENQLPSDLPPPILLGCPKGVFAGQNIDVYVECAAGSINNVTLSGPNTGYVETGDYISISTNNSTVNGGATGPLTITVECADDLGNVSTETCEVEVFPTDSVLEFQSSGAVCAEAVECQTSCVNCTRTFCVTRCEPICQEGFFTGVAKDCPPVIEPPNKDKPVKLTEQFLTPVKQIAAPNLGEPIDDCCDDDPKYYLYKHAPTFCWNNLCGCPGWEVTGNGLLDTSPLNACCYAGKPWIFDGAGLAEFSGPDTKLVSCAIIWGHNIASGTVTTFPPVDVEPGQSAVKNIELCYDEACVAGYTRPIVINLEATETNVAQMAINGTTVDGGPIRINHIFMGNKFFFEEDALPGNFTNPHTGSDFYVETKENDCGFIINREVVRQRKTLSFDLDCLSEEWLATKWSSYINYLRSGQPVYFQWSRNGYSDQIFMGDLTSAVAGSTYNGIFQSMNFTIEGYCSQPQTKRLVA